MNKMGSTWSSVTLQNACCVMASVKNRICTYNAYTDGAGGLTSGSGRCHPTLDQKQIWASTRF